MPELVVSYTTPALSEAAQRLAMRLGVPALPADEVATSQLSLRMGEDGLALSCDGMELMPDFAEMKPRLKQGALQRELLVKAARIKGVDAPTAVDATAGLGEDSLLLAAAGFEVTLCEADPVIAALLRDALQRAGDDPMLEAIVARMHVVEGDSKDVLHGVETPPDLVYLDPMFPKRSKTAAVKKKFQLIHHLERPCDPQEEELLLQAALAAHPRKVVIKRPVKGAYLAGIKPSHSIAGKAVRYDCLVPPRPEHSA
ncbi:class I SAM-dependent methyltransferase [Collinsella provencensis]|uniref:class I SAM-dependent methyltransferase n=1 Tax=Collinsella provencensis TaxID=1937461 RepID=UPI001F3B5871|nr:class I SAM-dependent methyltransferase [Collinsella provencensis]